MPLIPYLLNGNCLPACLHTDHRDKWEPLLLSQYFQRFYGNIFIDFNEIFSEVLLSFFLEDDRKADRAQLGAARGAAGEIGSYTERPGG